MWLLTNPMGEEVTEGVLGGLVAGAGQLGADQSIAETALQTGTAMAGGVGLGMAGRRIGAYLGNKVHEGPLKNQEGVLANVARVLGQETTAEGLGDQYRLMRTGIEEELVRATSARMAREAMDDPEAFFRKHGITAEQFNRLLPDIEAGRGAAQMFKMVKEIPEETRDELIKNMVPGLDEYQAVEDAVARQAASSSKETLREAAADMRNEGDFKIGQHSMADALESLAKDAKLVRGKHVGRFLGRFLGDELGVIGGLMAGSMVADAMGLQSNKDKKIADLEQQLSQGRR
jgi:hypothetical protein